MITLNGGARAAVDRSVASHQCFGRLVAAWNRLVSRWKAWREARVEARLDAYWTRYRTARERYLSTARDPYELERLERQWERHHDFWRVR